VVDESLAALDPETRLRVLEEVKRRAGTLVLIEHGEACGSGENGVRWRASVRP
jgi:ABC-type bacteriocin/lantibiotic exporter with double-glycine peptidase domain